MNAAPRIPLRTGAACDGCGACAAACRRSHGSEPGRAAIQLVSLNGWPTPLLCRHCQDAPCVASCMAGCRHRESATGPVITDYARCVGCWMCIMACPFGAIQRLPSPPDRHHGTAFKCDGCTELPHPPCVAACPKGVLTITDPLQLSRELRERAAHLAADRELPEPE